MKEIIEKYTEEMKEIIAEEIILKLEEEIVHRLMSCGNMTDHQKGECAGIRYVIARLKKMYVKEAKC